jgi:PIN domain nuclease of toxin-antitoxin system
MPEPPHQFISVQRELHRITPLPLEEEATLYLGRLPKYHRDPFDRMLVCQSIVHGMTILTPDELVVQYPVRSLW